MTYWMVYVTVGLFVTMLKELVTYAVKCRDHWYHRMDEGLKYHELFYKHPVLRSTEMILVSIIGVIIWPVIAGFNIFYIIRMIRQRKDLEG